MIDPVLLSILDHPIFTNVLFLLLFAIFIGVFIGMISGYLSVGAMGGFLFFIHITLGSQNSLLMTFLYAIIGVFIVYLAFSLYPSRGGGTSP